MPTIHATALRDFAADLLIAGGFTPEDAAQTAELLVWANLRGVDSHGVLRIPRYVEMIALGLMTSGGRPDVVHEFGAISVIDGGKCPGAVGMNMAVDKAAQTARKFGLGWCAARRISHAGAVGYFTQKLAAQGLVGLAMTASKPLMSYIGARGEALSTNPLSIAVPTGTGGEPILLDMSTASVALGKIMAAKDAGRTIPEGWAIDSDGNPATDPHKVAALLPMAGAKGSGLSLMIELLTSVLAGNAVIGPELTGEKSGGFNGMVLAIAPEAFGQDTEFLAEVDRLARAIHALDPIDPTTAPLLPGERGTATAQLRAAEGIPLAPGTANRLKELAQSLGATTPDGF
jgi:LDH2 family malate/lactate/ureidoglycolate dehydrogenase